jgi:ion channel-forming bestrophin family protein
VKTPSCTTQTKLFGIEIGLAVAFYEIAGFALAVLLVLRTNAGYDRWWEARKLWGGIVNQSRNLVGSALAYGPADATWRESVVGWAASFPHIARASLRGERPPPEVVALIGPEAANRLAEADHMPSYVALVLGRLLRQACEQLGMDRFAFMQIDRQRAELIDHIGACERILKTPLPLAYAIKIRRFIILFLLTLPLALLHRIDALWLVPVITMLVAYPLVSLDQLGVELQNPFATRNLSHLPLDDISATIERNLKGVLRADTPLGGPQ